MSILESKYIGLEIRIKFLEEVSIRDFPAYVISKMTRQVKKTYCISPKSRCDECDFKEKCYYPYFVGSSNVKNGKNDIPDVLVIDPLPTRIYKEHETKVFRAIFLKESAEKAPMFIYMLDKVGNSRKIKFVVEKITTLDGKVLFEDEHFYPKNIDEL